MRTANPFFLSVGIHFTLVALIITVVSVAQKSLPVSSEKTMLKILLQPSEQSVVSPIFKQEPLPKVIEPLKVPLPQQPRAVIPPTPRTAMEMKSNVPTPQMIPTPVEASAVVSKTSATVPVLIPKASPQKVEENYEEENLGRIRSILAERLKYPKNALRLKQQGETTVTFTLGSNREISQITISQSSGFELLDSAAKDLIESSASEFPTPKKTVRITVPIAYHLR